LLIYLVLPDLSMAKIGAVLRLHGEGFRFGILVSYTTLLRKPEYLGVLRALKAKAPSLPVMLDSGAYHVRALGSRVGVRSYARFAYANRGLFDLVVAPDVPGAPRATIARTLLFKRFYDGAFIPVIQGVTVEDYTWCLGEMRRIADVGHVGVGGLDGERRRPGFLRELLNRLCDDSVKLHLFGVGPGALARLREYDCVVSTDSGTWSMGIIYRRRDLKAQDPVELNYIAMRRHVERYTKLR